jgi:glycosyltransferase involved in cell wall biosynthesis
VEVSLKQNVKVYSLTEHKGKGYALRAGFAKAKGDIIVTIDSDGSNRPEELPILLKLVLENKADMVIGSRFSGKRPTSGKMFNAAGVRLFNLLVRILTGASVSDSQSGYRVMKRKVLDGLRLKSNTYEIESEMLVKIAQKRFRVEEVPVSFEQRTYGVTTLDPIVDGFKIFMSIFMSYLKG